MAIEGQRGNLLQVTQQLSGRELSLHSLSCLILVFPFPLACLFSPTCRYTPTIPKIISIPDYLCKLLISERTGPIQVQEALLLEGGHQPAVCGSHSRFSGQAFWRAPLKQIWADSSPLWLGLVKYPADYLQLP